MRYFASLAGLVCIGATAVQAAAPPQVSTTSFEQCVATIQLVSTKLGVAPTNIVETNIFRMVRFPADDGSLLVSCSRPDNKMVIQPSDKRCGIDVNC